MKTIKQRFDEKVLVTPGCWLWQAGRDRGGYGRFRLGKEKARAHRVSYQLYVGEIQNDLYVLHRCDNPQCVNPDHLFLGTNQDNVRDMCQKGRQAKGAGIFAMRRTYKGEGSPNAKLTEVEVKAILADTRIYRLIAASYGVCIATVSHIKNGRVWASLGIV